MDYAKIDNGKILYAPNPLRIGDVDVFTTDPTPYGYKPVVYPPVPEAEGMMAVFDGWEETDTEIRQKWRLEPMPEPEASIEDYEEALAELGVK